MRVQTYEKMMSFQLPFILCTFFGIAICRQPFLYYGDAFGITYAYARMMLG